MPKGVLSCAQGSVFRVPSVEGSHPRLRSGVSAHHRRAAGDVEHDAGDPRRIVRRKEEGGVRDVVRSAEAPDGVHRRELRLLRLGDALLVLDREDRLGALLFGPVINALLLGLSITHLTGRA
jgi:hypothetical protein